MDDNRTLKELMSEVQDGAPGPRQCRLESQALSDQLRRGNAMPGMELYTFTDEDLASMEVLGIRPGGATRLDREPVTESSRRRVHLVIFGAGAQAQSLAVHAALVAHYPNWVRDHGLRTRITLVSDALTDFHPFRQRYAGLLEHCWRRDVVAGGELPEVRTAAPRYHGVREEFTDIEWEFVEAPLAAPALQYKLGLWAADPDRLMTLAFCREDSSRNVEEALTVRLPGIPVWVHAPEASETLALLQQSGAGTLIPFGGAAADLDDYITLGMYVNYAYGQFKEQGKAPSVPDPEAVRAAWDAAALSGAKRWSNLYNAFSLTTKLRSVGIPEDRWGTFFALGERDAEVLTELEHNRWSVEELVLGLRPLTEEEREALRKDPSLRGSFKAAGAHPDLCAFSELGADETGENVIRYDALMVRALPLLAYAWHQMKEGSHA